MISQVHVEVLKVVDSQHANDGCEGCVPVTSQAHVTVLNVAASQQASVGCVGCDPVIPKHKKYYQMLLTHNMLMLAVLDEE